MLLLNVRSNFNSDFNWSIPLLISFSTTFLSGIFGVVFDGVGVTVVFVEVDVVVGRVVVVALVMIDTVSITVLVVNVKGVVVVILAIVDVVDVVDVFDVVDVVVVVVVCSYCG